MNCVLPKRARSRGRPLAFSLDQALDAATALFAAKGYEQTSLSDLTRAMGINRPSLYLHFGNKEALYLKALKRHTQLRVGQVADCLSGTDARTGVERFVRAVIDSITDPAGAGACFLTQAPLNAPEVTDKTRRELAGRRNFIAMMLRARLDRAVEDGELPRDTATGPLAGYYGALIQGLALEAQHGVRRDELLGIMELAMRAWPSAA